MISCFWEYLQHSLIVMEENLQKLSNEDDGMLIYKKLCRLRNMKKHTKDHLELLFNATFKVMQFKIVRLIFIYVFCQYSFATILTIYYLLTSFSSEALLKHASFCGIQIFVLINLGSLVFMIDEFSTLATSFRKLTLIPELLAEKDYKDIMLYVKLIKLICCINMVLAVLAFLGFFLAPEWFNRKTYLVVWIRETFPEYSEYMVFIVSLTSLPVALMLAGSSITWAYGIFHGVIQVMVMNEAVKNICSSSTLKEQRYNSELYQKIVKQKLMICLTIHQHSSSFIRLIADTIEKPLTMFAIGGVILGASLMIEVLSSEDSDFGGEYAVYMGIVCFAIDSGISANLYVMTAEWLKEVSEGTYDTLVQLPWYDLNAENKQILSIFMRRLESPLTVTTSLVQIDFLLLVRIVKALYSMAAMLARFVSSSKV